MNNLIYLRMADGNVSFFVSLKIFLKTFEKSSEKCYNIMVFILKSYNQDLEFKIWRKIITVITA